VQAPAIRLSREKAIALLPAVRRAAKTIGDIEAEALPAARARA